MTIRKGHACVALLAVFSLSFEMLAQGRRNQQQEEQQKQQQAQAQAQQAVGPVPQSREEADAFNALQKEQAPDRKVQLAEAFIAKFPESDFAQFVQMSRLGAYSQLGNHKEAAAAGEQAIAATVKFGEKLLARADADAKLTDKDKENIRRKDKNAVFLDKNSPQFQAFMNQSEQRILAFHQAIITSYQQLNDSAKMIEWGEKALGFNPDDLNTITMLSNVMAERPPANETQKAEHMKRAEQLANQAIETLPKFFASPEAANVPATAKADLTAQMHYTRGLIYLHQKRLGSAQQEFLTSLKFKPTDPITLYRLGIAYVQDAKTDQAIDVLAQSAFLKGVAEAGAREILKQLWVNKNKSEQGMEDYIKAAGGKIGK
jgi:tetratricopeptide (TPR) repeat protein